jgi:hypothetical protein
VLRHELLKHYREAAGCVFHLWLTFDAGRHDDEVSFSEYYDYAARPGDSGREYGYSVLVPRRDLDRLVEVVARRAGRPPGEDTQATLLDCFQALVARGELGEHLDLRENVGTVRSWLDDAGIASRTDQWAWFNSD